MSLKLEQWQYPIGRYQPKQDFSAKEIQVAIAILKAFPTELKELYHNVANKIMINHIAQEGGPSSNLFTI